MMALLTLLYRSTMTLTGVVVQSLYHRRGSIRQSRGQRPRRARALQDRLHVLSPCGSRPDRTANSRTACRMALSVAPGSRAFGPWTAAISSCSACVARRSVEACEIVCRNRDHARFNKNWEIISVTFFLFRCTVAAGLGVVPVAGLAAEVDGARELVLLVALLVDGLDEGEHRLRHLARLGA